MKRILIIRPSAIGDVVMASPMIRVLRNTWPQATIAWLSDPIVSCLLDHHPAIDEVICWSKQRWQRLIKKGRFLRLAREIKAFSRNLKLRRFDLALDAQGLFRSRLLAFLSGANERIGFKSREPGSCFMTRMVSRGPDSKEMSSEYRHLLQVMGLRTNHFEPEVILAPQYAASAEAKLRALNVGGHHIAVCPFTTRPQKHWIEDRWSKLAGRLIDTFGWPVVILGGSQDASAGRQLQQGHLAHIRNLCGQTSLGEAAAIVEKADLVIGVDTGLTHLGTAFKRPTVALFGATCPYLTTPNARTIVVYNAFECSPCRRRPTCNGKRICMESIEVDQVLAAARQATQT